MKLKICPLCDSKKFHEETKNVFRTLRGRRVLVPSVTYWHCEKCGEKFYPPQALRKIEEYLKRKAA